MKALRIFTALLLIFFVLNYWSRKFLPFAYADVADYSLLYTTDRSVYISKLNVVNDSLEFSFNGLPAKTTVTRRYSRNEYGTDTGSFTFLGNRFRYKPPPGKPQQLNINGHRLNVSYSAGNGLQYEVTSPDLPVEPALVRKPADWSSTAWKDDKRIKWLYVEDFVPRTAGISDSDNTVEKILKIGRMVLAGMPPDQGKPSESVAAMHPLDQYTEAKAGKINLWCGNYAAIFSCFATAVDIPTRIVFTGISKDNIGLGNHVFCEAYIKEKDCWAYVDLTNNTVLLQRGDRYLNALDLHRLLQYEGGIGQVSSHTVVGDSMQTVPFDSMSSNARFYFTKNTFFTFFYKYYFAKYSNAGPLQRISNLFETRPMYAVYSDNLPGRNYHFLARIISNYLLIAAASLWLVFFAAWLIPKFRKRS